MAVITSRTGARSWNTATDWVGDACPVDNVDSAVIAADCQMLMNQDQSGYTNGILGVTISGHATTPGMLYFKDGTSGYLKIKTGYNLLGTTGTLKGRLLANSDGTWGNTGSLAFADKAVIDLGATSKIDAQYLSVALYCTNNMAHKYLRTYGVRHTVTGSAAADTLTKTSHGLTNTTPVMIMSDGALPAPLEVDTIYYVVNTATDTFKLADVSGGTAIDLTTDGSGTIEVYTGAASGADPVSVFEDVTAETGWTNATGHNRVVIANAGPQNYDQQRLTITTLDTNHIHLSAALDSTQYPGARIYLVSRNVSVRSSCTTGVTVVDYSSASGSGGVYQCEIASTAGTGTTFYGTPLYYGTGHVVSGTLWGGSNGGQTLVNSTISGVIVGCGSGLYGGSGCTVSGYIAGCGSGAIYTSAMTLSGDIRGCSDGTSYNRSNTMSGTVFGCTNGMAYGSGCVVSGNIRACTIGLRYGSGYYISGSVMGCGTGIQYGAWHTLTGTVKRCGTSFSMYANDVMCGMHVMCRNATLDATPAFANRNVLGGGSPFSDQGVLCEDYNGVVGASYSYFPTGDVIKNTTTVRVGGAASSLEVVPLSNCSTLAPIRVFEWTELDVPASAQTKSVYVKGEGWSSFPTNAQLYFEAEYYSDDAPITKTTVASTQVIDENTNWHELSVTFTPHVASLVRYRLFLKTYAASCKVYVDNQLNTA